MPIVNGYTTLAELKSRLQVPDSGEDASLEAVIAAVSRQIDDWTGRRFYAASQTRYYTADGPDTLFVDDLLSVASLKTDEDGDRVYDVTWAATDYDLEPANAPLESQPQPYTRVVTAPSGRYAFPSIRRGIELVGSFGFASATPPVVGEACLLQAGRIYNRRNNPFGIGGSPDIGTVRLMAALDPDVKAMLAPLRRVVVA